MAYGTLLTSSKYVHQNLGAFEPRCRPNPPRHQVGTTTKHTRLGPDTSVALRNASKRTRWGGGKGKVHQRWCDQQHEHPERVQCTLRRGAAVHVRFRHDSFRAQALSHGKDSECLSTGQTGSRRKG